ncbi:DNA (cytosine-5-)-methyltransferase [Isoptericola nanjingensis]|uniref:DNA (cytosine-5-)-methyltransferase n=1 Tax=Isoptericola nanjingensis TaxID=903413 RepID=UPI003D1F31B8
MSTDDQGFTFVDLFAGIGGFHAALASLGGRCVYAAEWNDKARAVYENAWRTPELARGIGAYPFVGNINDDVPVLPESALAEASSDLPDFPDHDVLAAGFPCQAFSKSGKQQGILDATRGTLFYNILRIVRAKRPRIVFLENVRNLAGPKHRPTFKAIVDSLFELGYVVSDDPTVISPHRIHPDQGGTPQMRERIYILAVHRTALGTEAQGTEDRIRWTDENGPFLRDVAPFSAFSYGTWDPQKWRIRTTPLALYDGEPVVLPDERLGDRARLALRDEDGGAIDAWDAFVRRVVARRGLSKDDGVRRLPGHPIWTGVMRPLWLARERADANSRAQEGSHWKNAFLDSNERTIDQHRVDLEATVKPLHDKLPESRWKFEWQAQDASSLDECLIQLRPSGIRVKKDTYTPALVAINQTTILGKERRRLAPAETVRLQGFPDFVSDVMASLQTDAESYKQLGNAVHVGAVGFALAQLIEHFENSFDLDPRLREIRRRWERRWSGGTGPSSAEPAARTDSAHDVDEARAA